MSEQNRELLMTARNISLIAWDASAEGRLPAEVFASVFEVIVEVIDKTLQSTER